MLFKKRRSKTWGRRLFSLPALLICVFLAVSLSCLFFVAKAPLNQWQRGAVAKQDVLIRNQVYTAVSALEALHQKTKSGELTMARAKKLGADMLREMRYGDRQDGYFFADTVDGVNVVLYGDKSTEGRNRLEDNVNGIYYVKELIKTGQQGGGYVNYWYPKQGEMIAKEKRSFVLEFKPFGWVVGTGYYLEDIR